MKIKGKQLEDTLRSEDAPFTAIYSTSIQSSSLEGALRFKCKNGDSVAMSKGQAVYLSGVSGDVPLVQLADADGASTMPAVGLTEGAASVNAEVYVVSFGNLTGLNTAALGTDIVGKSVYVNTTAGGLTVTPPSGSSAKLQNIGQVVREHGTEGIIKVGGAGRTAATPNLDQGKFFVGNASNQSTQSAYTVPTADGSADQMLQTDGAGAVTFVNPKSASFLTLGENEPLTDQTSQVEFKTTNGAQNGQGWRVPLAGEVTHLSVQFDCVSSINTVNFSLYLYKNGTQQGTAYNVQVNATGDFGASFALATPLSFSAGDRIGIRAAHSATGCTTTDHAVLVRLVTDTY